MSRRIEQSIEGSNGETIVTNEDTIGSDAHLVSSVDKKFDCDINGCNHSFKQYKELYRHKRDFHTEKDPDVCKHCYQVFYDSNLFKIHSVDTHNKPVLECDSCDYLTQSKQNLNNHKKRVHSKRPFGCPVDGCHKGFFTELERQNHLVVHTEDRPFKCDVFGCDLSYKRRSDLSGHKNRCHSVSKEESNHLESSQRDLKSKPKSKVWKHRCLWCGCSYRTDNSDDFRQHKIFHVNFRPFKCLEIGCSHAFISQLQLDSHVRNGHKS